MTKRVFARTVVLWASIAVSAAMAASCSSGAGSAPSADGGGPSSSGSSSGAAASGIVCSETAGLCGAAHAECNCSAPENAPSPDSGLPWAPLPTPSCGSYQCCAQYEAASGPGCICFNPACGAIKDCPTIAASLPNATVVPSCPWTASTSSSGGADASSSSGSGSGSSGGDDASADDASPDGSSPGAVVTAVSVGGDFACALLVDGTVECWGGNDSGELGNQNSDGTPMPVTGLTGVTAISAGGGGNFACALLMGGTVECWGDNQYGELGNGSTATNSWTPVAVSGLTGVTAISAGNYDACALLMGGTVKCWGDNEYGELDDGPATGPEMCSGYPCSSTPVAISGLTGVTAISAGGGSSICVLLSGGTVKCWGDNYGGELGNGSTGPETCEGEPCATAAAVSGLTGVSAISEGDYSACALLSGGTVKCWGDAGDGELGNGSSTAAGTCGSGACSTTPVATSLTGVTAVSVGVRSACALLTNGTVECWGWNEYGQLGDGTRTGPGTCSGDPCSTTPVAVTGLTGVTAISESSDGEGVCALLSGGTVECWGLAAESMSSTPVAVTGL